MIKTWWNEIQKLFCLHIEINLLNFIFSVNILLIEFNIKTNLPYFFDYWTSLYGKIIKLTHNKTGEIQLAFENNLKTGINIHKYIHNDHNPFDFEVSILGFTIMFTIYDHRHWDYENNKYKELIILDKY